MATTKQSKEVAPVEGAAGTDVETIAPVVESLEIDATGLPSTNDAPAMTEAMQAMASALRLATSLRYPATEEEKKQGLPGKLTSGGIAAFALGIEGEPTELGLVKDYIRAMAELPDKPEDVALSLELRGMYDAWKVAESRPLIEQALAYRPDHATVIETFKKKCRYETDAGAWANEAQGVVAIIDTLIDTLKHARAQLSATKTTSAPRKATATATGRAAKVTADSDEAVFCACPYCEHVAKARNPSHVVSNLNKHILLRHEGEELVSKGNAGVYRLDSDGNPVIVE